MSLGGGSPYRFVVRFPLRTCVVCGAESGIEPRSLPFSRKFRRHVADSVAAGTRIHRRGKLLTYQTDGSGVYIYILDAGVERNHTEFDDDNDPNTPQVNPRVKDGPS